MKGLWPDGVFVVFPADQPQQTGVVNQVLTLHDQANSTNSRQAYDLHGFWHEGAAHYTGAPGENLPRVNEPWTPPMRQYRKDGSKHPDVGLGLVYDQPPRLAIYLRRHLREREPPDFGVFYTVMGVVRHALCGTGPGENPTKNVRLNDRTSVGLAKLLVRFRAQHGNNAGHDPWGTQSALAVLSGSDYGMRTLVPLWPDKLVYGSRPFCHPRQEVPSGLVEAMLAQPNEACLPFFNLPATERSFEVLKLHLRKCRRALVVDRFAASEAKHEPCNCAQGELQVSSIPNYVSTILGWSNPAQQALIDQLTEDGFTVTQRQATPNKWPTTNKKKRKKKPKKKRRK